MKREKITQTITNDFKKVTAVVKKLPCFLALNAFLVILILILVDVLIGGFLFYKYIYLPEKQSPQNNLSQLIFNDKGYRAVLEEWQKRENTFSKGIDVELKNPFK